MPGHSNSAQEILSYLRMQGPTLSSELVAHFGISRPTLSRRVQELGYSVITIGKGRATQLAARHEDWLAEEPLYQVQENGQVELFGQLHPIRAGTQCQWFIVPEKIYTSLMWNEFKDGLFPGWPWFLEDLRPSGFLGRAFGKDMAERYQFDTNPEKWSDIELLRTLLGHGHNLSGNFIVGNGRALIQFQWDRVQAEKEHYLGNPEEYPVKAELSLTKGEQLGSSAGGEQPKFTTMVCDTPEATPRAVIVKFSPPVNDAVGQRWADLLYAECIASQLLSEMGFATARTRIFKIKGRVFLESERFDRIGFFGRRGLVTLRALDAAYVGQAGGSWAEIARKLHADRWITEEDRGRMVRLHCFGQLIANNDMHWGNLSFFLPKATPFPLAPVYDMLPMYFRPSGTGEIVERRFEPKLPKPEDQAVWLEMYPHALKFWRRVQEYPEISADFKEIAKQVVIALRHIHELAIS